MDWTDREMELNPTMTITDLCEFFKANCIPAAPDTMGRYITEGKFPFAVGLDGSADGKRKRNFIISGRTLTPGWMPSCTAKALSRCRTARPKHEEERPWNLTTKTAGA